MPDIGTKLFAILYLRHGHNIRERLNSLDRGYFLFFDVKKKFLSVSLLGDEYFKLPNYYFLFLGKHLLFILLQLYIGKHE